MSIKMQNPLPFLRNNFLLTGYTQTKTGQRATKFISVHNCFSTIWNFLFSWGFPDNPVGKESTCNAGDPGLIPGSRSSPREGIGYPLQYSWASSVAQKVKYLPAMLETWFDPWVVEDPLEEGMATNSSILVWKIPWTEELDGLQFMGWQRVRHN